ncbi:hypothetical protein ACFL2S_13140 [Thermodesulfobacteriota bacterium]
MSGVRFQAIEGFWCQVSGVRLNGGVSGKGGPLRPPVSDHRLLSGLAGTVADPTDTSVLLTPDT